MDTFKFIFLSVGQLESLSLDKLFKILLCSEVFWQRTLFLPLSLECSAEIISSVLNA